MGTDRIVNKIYKLAIPVSIRNRVASLVTQAAEQARREVTAEIVDMLKADMIEARHLGHLDAVDMITSNYPTR